MSFVQDLLVVPLVLESLTSLAEVEPKVAFTKGYLRLKPGKKRSEVLF